MSRAGDGPPAPGRRRVRLSVPWWELCGRIPLALHLGLSGLALVVAQAVRLAGPDPAVRVLLPGLAVGILLVAAAAGAARGRFALAGVYLAIVLGAAALRHLRPGAEPVGGGQLAAAGLYGLGATWILLHRWRGGPALRAGRVIASVALAGWFAALLPVLGRDMGRSLGMALHPAGPAAPAGVGERLPDLRFRRLDGVWTHPDEPGTLHVVSFWATWCRPCLVELPALQALADDLHGHPPVRLLAVNTEALAPDILSAFLARQGLGRLPAATDPESWREVMGIRVLPTTLLLRDRRVLARFEGYRADLPARLRAEVARLRGIPAPEEDDRPDG